MLLLFVLPAVSSSFHCICSRHFHVIACPPPNIVYPRCSSSPRKTFSRSREEAQHGAQRSGAENCRVKYTLYVVVICQLGKRRRPRGCPPPSRPALYQRHRYAWLWSISRSLHSNLRPCTCRYVSPANK